MGNLDSPQWRRAQQTSLWKRTLGSDDEDVKPLRESFLDARENAAVLLDKIRPDFPNLTIHDITHVDSLWTVADAIIGENYPINPLEGYVLGIAFLIHDAALSYDAVGGKDKLRNTIEWKDAYADGLGDKDEDEFKKECDFTAIRAIHAREAKEIMTRTFSSDDIPSFHIVKKASYRQSLGESIGKIAASHHWSIDEIESKLDIQITPSVEVSGPGDWDINEQKLACILRCADAGHIDDGRAPYYIFRSLNLNGVSLEHWKYQSNLGIVQPYRKDKSKLLITSTSSFKKEDFAAWNVAYEAVKLFDEEIKKSNNLLKSIDEQLVFPRTGVLGASSKEELAEHIKTEGWLPCNFGVHTSNIKLLIENLGGSKLYGEENKLLVVLRELIQNARDAILARQKLESRFDNGKIIIRLIEEGEEPCIEIEDNGIGMSMDCIKYNLLDFGSSYWKSSLSKYENRGLKSKGFESIGQFGIGFYSVFMVASSVDVYTKRFEKGSKEAKRIEFPEGLTLSPIISNCELDSTVSTIIRFYLKKEEQEMLFVTGEKSFQHILSLKQAIPIIVAGLDTDVYYDDEKNISRIHSNINSKDFDKKEWLENILLHEYKQFNYLGESLEFLEDKQGKKRGLVAMPDVNMLQTEYPSIKTVNGLFTSLKDVYNSYSFVGFINSNEARINRDELTYDDELITALQKWIIRKYIENHDVIIESYVLSELYYRMMNDYGITYDEKQKLINLNTRILYRTYKERGLEIDTYEGLCKIYDFIYSGIIPNTNKPEFFRFSGYYLSHNSSFKEKINSKVHDYESIINKYVVVFQGSRLDIGIQYSVPEVWLNLMLHCSLNKMIDWRMVDLSRYSELWADIKYNHKNYASISKYLEQFLTISDFSGDRDNSIDLDS